MFNFFNDFLINLLPTTSTYGLIYNLCKTVIPGVPEDKFRSLFNLALILADHEVDLELQACSRGITSKFIHFMEHNFDDEMLSNTGLDLSVPGNRMLILTNNFRVKRKPFNQETVISLISCMLYLIYKKLNFNTEPLSKRLQAKKDFNQNLDDPYSKKGYYLVQMKGKKVKWATTKMYTGQSTIYLPPKDVNPAVAQQEYPYKAVIVTSDSRPVSTLNNTDITDKTYATAAQELEANGYSPNEEFKRPNQLLQEINNLRKADACSVIALMLITNSGKQLQAYKTIEEGIDEFTSNLIVKYSDTSWAQEIKARGEYTPPTTEQFLEIARRMDISFNLVLVTDRRFITFYNYDAKDTLLLYSGHIELWTGQPIYSTKNLSNAEVDEIKKMMKDSEGNLINHDGEEEIKFNS